MATTTPLAAKKKYDIHTYADIVDQDQTARNVQSDLDLHCPIFIYVF